MTNTEHEKLKEICDVIGYKINDSFYYWDKKWTLLSNRWENIAINPREIIFTKEFMERYLPTVFDWKTDKEVQKFRIMLTHNLHAPVNYLYNKLW